MTGGNTEPKGILIVEDSRTQAAAMERVLLRAGYRVQVVRDGQKALEAVETGRFELVLSDVQMPVIDGYELCRRIKTAPSTRRLPVMLLTSLESPDDVLAGLECGADSFVSKPFDAEVLLGRIARLLRVRASADVVSTGEFRLFDQKLPLILDRDHAVEYLSATFEDYVRVRARERKATTEARDLKQSELFLQAVLDGVSSCVGIVDKSGSLVSTNDEWNTFAGKNPLVGPDHPPGIDFLSLCREHAEEHRCARTLADGLPALLDGSKDELNVECTPHCSDGWRCFRVRASRLGNDGPPKAVMSFHDVTDLKLAEARLQHAAHHDPLTGLPNRALFLERLERALSRARRSRMGVAVLFCDLDRFKIVNDSLGHAAGDELLIEVSRRISGAIREQDTAARFGGDEFAVVLEGYVDEFAVFQVAERLQRMVTTPAEVAGQEVFTTMSIGIAIAATPLALPEDLMRDADTAMYRAKEAGKARFVVFDKQMHARSLAHLQFQGDLRKAIDGRQLFLLYQPIIALGSHEVVGLEALVRWLHPTRGVVPPVDFIPLAEETGLINPIGMFVLEEACAQIARWRQARGGSFPFRMHVNLSGRQLAGSSFVKAVRDALKEHQLPASVLEFELTESVVLTTGDDVAQSVPALRELGAGLSMDDFGTGFSSLSALRQLPFTTLKLDRSFVGSSDEDPQNLAIVGSLVALGLGMQLDVVAEGVERPAQLRLLEAMGCQLAQGYLFAKPLPADEAGPLLGTVMHIDD